MRILERRLQLSGVVAISLSAMLGSGLFVLPGIAVSYTGEYLWYAYLLTSICVLPAALAKAELATAMPTSGGAYVFLDRTFGPLVGMIAGLGVWISLLLKSAFALVGFGAYLSVLADLPLVPTALVLLLCITALNSRGVKAVSNVLKNLVIIIFAGLFVVIVGGFIGEAPKMPASSTDALPVLGLWQATALLFVSYAGVTKIAAVAEEIKKPERNLPLGILISWAIATVLYCLLSYILVQWVSVDELNGDLKPIFTLADRILGTWGGYAICILGIVTMTSMANAGLLTASRFPLAMSRDNLLPAAMRHLHPERLTPTVSIFVSALIVASSIIFLDVASIAKLASVFMLLMFTMNNLALIVLRETGVQWYEPKYKIPLYPWIPIFGIISGLGIVAVSGPLGWLGALALILFGALFYFIYGARRTDRQGVVRQRSRRADLFDDPSEKTLTDTQVKKAAMPVSTLVTLFGHERSPETLVDLANSFREVDALEVLHLTELPEQTALDVAKEESPRLQSVERRIQAMAKAEQIPLRFESMVSRDIIKTVHQMSENLHCQWLIMEWGQKPKGTFTFANPLGWLKGHLPCNLAIFYDAGVRYMRKILVSVDPGPNDALVLSTADHFAQLHDGDITLVRFVPDSAPMTEVQSANDYLDELRPLCESPTEVLVLRGKGQARAMAQASAAYDLLVMGEEKGVGLRHWWDGNLADRITDNAACSVLRVQTPRTQTHEAVQQKPELAHDTPTRIVSFIPPGCVEAKLKITKKEGFFEHVASIFAAQMQHVSKEHIVKALWEREKLQNTSVGNGLALPHATLPESDRTYLGVFTSAKPVNYDAPDGGDVDVFFFTLGPPADRQKHLLLLASVSRLVLGTQLLDKIRLANDDLAILDAIHQAAMENE
ncbi:MAG: amino acid permease [Myxococcota bacterium]|nr:amino acid permease [Myxococcota bacterium]